MMVIIKFQLFLRPVFIDLFCDIITSSLLLLEDKEGFGHVICVKHRLEIPGERNPEF